MTLGGLQTEILQNISNAVSIKTTSNWNRKHLLLRLKKKHIALYNSR